VLNVVVVTSSVGRCGGSSDPDVVNAGHDRPLPHARSVWQQPPPSDSGHDLKSVGQTYVGAVVVVVSVVLVMTSVVEIEVGVGDGTGAGLTITVVVKVRTPPPDSVTVVMIVTVVVEACRGGFTSAVEV
jgi:hypothetical protein